MSENRLLDILNQPSTADVRNRLMDVVTNRATFFPAADYADGSTRWAWPGAIYEPAAAFYRMATTGQTTPADALNVAGSAIMGGVPFAQRGALGMAGGKMKTPGPGPEGLIPEAGATGASRVLAETPQTMPVRDVASQVAEQLGFGVYHSSGTGGSSSYLRTPLGDVRISDHGVGERRFHSEPMGYSASDGVEAIVASLRKRLEAASVRGNEHRAQLEAERASRLAASEPQRQQEAANRAAKEQFWRDNGLIDATQTAKDKAWKNYRSGK